MSGKTSKTAITLNPESNFTRREKNHFLFHCDSWTGFTPFYSFGRETSRGIFVVGRRRRTKRQATSRPDHLCPEIWKSMGRNAQLKEKQKWSNGRTRENYEEFISLTLRTRNSKRPLRMPTRNWKQQWLPVCLQDQQEE